MSFKQVFRKVKLIIHVTLTLKGYIRRKVCNRFQTLTRIISRVDLAMSVRSQKVGIRHTDSMRKIFFCSNGLSHCYGFSGLVYLKNYLVRAVFLKVLVAVTLLVRHF